MDTDTFITAINIKLKAPEVSLLVSRHLYGQWYKLCNMCDMSVIEVMTYKSLAFP